MTDIYPSNFHQLSSKIKKLNPNFNYLFFNRNQIISFIDKNYPFYKACIKNLRYIEAQKNFISYLLIYHYGGIYLDFDIEIYKSFNDLNFNKLIFPLQFTNYNNLVLRPQGNQILLGNYFFYSPKNHSFILKILNSICCNHDIIYQNFDYQRFIFYLTGPVLITQIYLFHKDKYQIEILSKKPFKNNAFGNYGKSLKKMNLNKFSTFYK